MNWFKISQETQNPIDNREKSYVDVGHGFDIDHGDSPKTIIVFIVDKNGVLREEVSSDENIKGHYTYWSTRELESALIRGRIEVETGIGSINTLVPNYSFYENKSAGEKKRAQKAIEKVIDKYPEINFKIFGDHMSPGIDYNKWYSRHFSSDTKSLKISQEEKPSYRPRFETYLGIGHGSDIFHDEKKYEKVILYVLWKNGQYEEREIEADSNIIHTDLWKNIGTSQSTMSGRVEVGSNRGSILIDNSDTYRTYNKKKQEKDISTIIQKFPGVNFHVFNLNDSGGPGIPLQKWYQDTYSSIEKTLKISQEINNYLDIGHQGFDNGEYNGELGAFEEKIDIILWSHDGKNMREVEVDSTKGHWSDRDSYRTLKMKDSIMSGRIEPEKKIGSITVNYDISNSNPIVKRRNLKRVINTIMDIKSQYPDIQFYIDAAGGYSGTPIDTFLRQQQKFAQYEDEDKYKYYSNIGHTNRYMTDGPVTFYSHNGSSLKVEENKSTNDSHTRLGLDDANFNDLMQGRIEINENVGSMAIRDANDNDPNKNKRIMKAIMDTIARFPAISFFVARQTFGWSVIPLNQYMKQLHYETNSQSKNWYKLSQTYEEIENNPSEYSDPDDPDYYNSSLYFSIGQNEESKNKSYCWIWENGKLIVSNKPGISHGWNFGHDRIREAGWIKGWYDPIQEMISVVLPGDENIKRTEEDVPGPILKALYNKFGINKIKVF